MTELTTADWRKSSRSGGGNGNCVEVAGANTRIGVRDSKDREGGMLVFRGSDWVTFLAGVKGDTFSQR